MKKFSIIIPAYNAQKYISRCLGSIFEQNYTNYEIILVDDCSSDKTVATVQNLKRQFPQVTLKIIRNQQNLGVSETRNVGMTKATGEYIMFVDADDRLQARDALARLAEKCSFDTDIVFFGGFINYVNQRDRTFWRLKLKIGRHDASQKFQLRRKVFRYTWLMCVRRELIQKHSLRFMEDMDFCEDVAFRTQVTAYTDRIATVPGIFYDYTRRLHHTSLSVGRDKTLREKLACLEKGFRRVDELAESGAVPTERVKDFLCVHRLHLFGICFVVASHFATKLIKERSDD